MEKSPAAATSHLEPVLHEPCGITIFFNFLIWCISGSQSILVSPSQACHQNPADKAAPAPLVQAETRIIKKRNKIQDADDMGLTDEDIKGVMRDIGLPLDEESSLVSNSIGNDCISRIFDDNEPSLQEVEQAFLVFDANNDGYFDALDLQRVLQSLGLRDGLGVYEYEQMISKYDTNRDGKIDMAEFDKVLEAGFF